MLPVKLPLRETLRAVRSYFPGALGGGEKGRNGRGRKQMRDEEEEEEEEEKKKEEEEEGGEDEEAE